MGHIEESCSASSSEVFVDFVILVSKLLKSADHVWKVQTEVDSVSAADKLNLRVPSSGCGGAGRSCS